MSSMISDAMLAQKLANVEVMVRELNHAVQERNGMDIEANIYVKDLQRRNANLSGALQTLIKTAHPDMVVQVTAAQTILEENK